jgi:hypothetical protein
MGAGTSAWMDGSVIRGHSARPDILLIFTFDYMYTKPDFTSKRYCGKALLLYCTALHYCEEKLPLLIVIDLGILEPLSLLAVFALALWGPLSLF